MMQAPGKLKEGTAGVAWKIIRETSWVRVGYPLALPELISLPRHLIPGNGFANKRIPNAISKGILLIQYAKS